MPIIGEGSYVPMTDYMHWFRHFSNLRIALFVAPNSERIQPRDWYTQQDMADVLESAMRMAHAIHLRGAPDWLYDYHLPDFLSHYDRVYTEWKGLAFDRPSFLRPIPPHVASSSLQTSLHVFQKRPRDDVDTEGETSGSHKRSRGDVNIVIETSAPNPLLETPTSISHPRITQIETCAPDPSLETPTSPSHPPITQIETCAPDPSLETPASHIIVQDMTIGPNSSELASLPTILRDHLEMNTHEDLFLDSKRRAGLERSGDMTRPLKNRKIRWLYRKWWSKESDFAWRDHGGGITFGLNWKQVQTIKPLFWLQDDVVNAYIELLKIRDFKMFDHHSSHLLFSFIVPGFIPQICSFTQILKLKRIWMPRMISLMNF